MCTADGRLDRRKSPDVTHGAINIPNSGKNCVDYEFLYRGRGNNFTIFRKVYENENSEWKQYDNSCQSLLRCSLVVPVQSRIQSRVQSRVVRNT